VKKGICFAFEENSCFSACFFLHNLPATSCICRCKKAIILKVSKKKMNKGGRATSNNKKKPSIRLQTSSGLDAKSSLMVVVVCVLGLVQLIQKILLTAKFKK
jgi:hypothetical protein